MAIATKAIMRGWYAAGIFVGSAPISGEVGVWLFGVLFLLFWQVQWDLGLGG